MNCYLYQIRQKDEYLLCLNSGNLFNIDDFLATGDFVLYFSQEIYFDDNRRNEVLAKISTKTKREVFFLPLAALLKELAQKELDNIKDDESIRGIFFGLFEILLFNFKKSDGRLKIVEESNSDLVPLERFIADVIGKPLSYKDLNTLNQNKDAIARYLKDEKEIPEDYVSDYLGNNIIDTINFTYAHLKYFIENTFNIILNNLQNVNQLIVVGQFFKILRSSSSASDLSKKDILYTSFSLNIQSCTKILLKSMINTYDFEIISDELGKLTIPFPIFYEDKQTNIGLITDFRDDSLGNIILNTNNHKNILLKSNG